MVTKGLFLILYDSHQEVVLSPVQDGDNKPQIDSNKANNYNIVKEVSSMSLSPDYYCQMSFCSVVVYKMCMSHL